MSDDLQQVDPLVEALQAEYDGLNPEHVDDLDRQLVEKYLRMIARRDDEAARIKAYADAEITRLQRSKDSIIRWRGYQVEEAVSRIISAQKAKSFKSAWGVAGFRYRSKPKLVYEKAETAQLIDWLYANLPTALRIPTPPAPSIHNESVTKAIAGGMACPFATVEPPSNDFYIKTNTKAPADSGAIVAPDGEVSFDE